MAAREEKITGCIDGHELVIRRKFNGSPERVFQLWTSVEGIARWWGPAGFTVPVCHIDLRVGGDYHFCMRSPQGANYWSKGSFIEIVPARRIVVTDSFSDEDGRIIAASSVGLPDNWPSTLLITITLEGVEDQTLMDLKHQGLPLQMVESCRCGWNEAFDKLAAIV